MPGNQRNIAVVLDSTMGRYDAYDATTQQWGNRYDPYQKNFFTNLVNNINQIATNAVSTNIYTLGAK